MSHSYISVKTILTSRLDQTTSGMKMSLFLNILDILSRVHCTLDCIDENNMQKGCPRSMQCRHSDHLAL